MTLHVVRRDAVCELRLDRPPGNVLDRETCLALARGIREQAEDRHLKAFLFTAAGRHFSYGASVPEHVAGEVERFLPAFHAVFAALMDASVPSIAAVQGLCLGGAFELAAFCPFVVAERSAAFSAPEISLGVLPPVACVVLPWRLGGALAEDMVLTGRRVPAEEAARRGLVTRLCDDGGLAAAVEALVDEAIRPRSAAALRLALAAVRGPFHERMRREVPALERTYLEELMATRDANEGIGAFLAKRAPVWVDA